MDITQTYAVVVGAVAFTFLMVTLLFALTVQGRYTCVRVSQHLTYTYVLGRHGLLGPWSVFDVLIQVIYLTANIFCLSFRAANVSEAGLRAATLSLINLIPLFSGPHLAFLADLLGMSWDTCRSVHRSSGFVSLALAVFHIVVVAATDATTFRTEFLHPFNIIVSRSKPDRGPLKLTDVGDIDVLLAGCAVATSFPEAFL